MVQVHLYLNIIIIYQKKIVTFELCSERPFGVDQEKRHLFFIGGAVVSAAD